MQIIDNINIKTIECKILNGRKVNIKIILDENIKLYSNEDIEIVNEIDDIKNLENHMVICRMMKLQDTGGTS